MTDLVYDLEFDDGEQINVVKSNDSYTYICNKISPQKTGVMLEYTDSGSTYRVHIPWHQIDRIYQEL